MSTCLGTASHLPHFARLAVSEERRISFHSDRSLSRSIVVVAVVDITEQSNTQAGGPSKTAS